jgi:hypothetical protein
MSLIGTFLGLLTSPFGMLAFLGGLVMFLILPMVPRVTNYFQSFARLHLWLAARMLQRASIILSEHGDLILKRISPDDIGTETASFDDDTKEFEDLNERKAKSSWMGIPFALADEVHGFLFTPIEAALGARKNSAEKRDEMVVKATAGERDTHNVQGWVRGVFSFPKDTHELVNLNKVRHLVTGIERAEHPQRVETFYELSREPYEEGTSATDMILILMAIVGPFAAIWVLASQLGFGGGGGPSSTVGYGSYLALLVNLGGLEAIRRFDWKKVAVSIVVLGPLPLLFVVLALFVSPIIAVMIFVIIGMGFWTLPLLIEILKISTGAANTISGLLLKSGFFGYEKPVWEYTARGYQIREFNKLDVDEENIVWHPFLGRTFGFTFDPDPSLWDDALVDTDSLKEKMEVPTDANTNVPSDYTRVPDKQRAVYGSFVPNRLKRSQYYVWTGIALERMKNVATGEKSHKRLTQSKEEHGSVSGLDQSSIMKTVFAGGLISFLAGLGVFILPAFL